MKGPTMRYDFVAISDADVPKVVEPTFQHVVTTYASEGNKTVSVWRAVPDDLLDFKPHEKTNPIRTILVHKLLSERRFVAQFLGTEEPPVGFTDWVEQIADSKNALDYRKRVSDPESASMWQTLSFGANYKAAYCLAVCPAGEEVIGPYLTDKTGHLRETVRPLQEKEETVYVVAGSDAEDHVARRFPLKTIKRVGNGLRPRSIQRFLSGLPLTFQPGKAASLNAVYHF